jgi:hypothetical protein
MPLKIADALEVSLDHLVGEGVHNGFDKKQSSAYMTWKLSKMIKRKQSLI